MKKTFAVLALFSLLVVTVAAQKKAASPAAVVGGTATAPMVTLGWVPSNGCVPPATGTGNCTAVTSFIILRSQTSGTETSYQTVPIASLVTCPTTMPPNNTQCWNDTVVVPGATYFYKVEAVNQAGAAAASNETSAPIAPVLTLPNPVGSLTATQP